MTGGFAERMQELADRVGNGNLEVTVTVDQVYAKYQHEGLDLRHPRGGRAKYLAGPLMESADSNLSNIADSILEDGGVRGAIDTAQHLINDVYLNAPVEFNDLKNSGSGRVTSDGHEVYSQPANVPRLTEEELKAKNRLRGRRAQ